MTASHLAPATAGGLAFALAARELGAGALALVRLSIFGVTLGALVATDLAERRIPNRIVIPAIATSLALSLTASAHGRNLAPARAIVAVLLVVALASPRAIGIGDVKLALLVAVPLDGAATSALFLGFALAGGAGVLLLVRRGRSAGKATLPLAPFLAAGALFAVVA